MADTASNCANPYAQNPLQQPRMGIPNIMQQLGADPVSKQAAAITDLAAAIRELADVLYHINTDD